MKNLLRFSLKLTFTIALLMLLFVFLIDQHISSAQSSITWSDINILAETRTTWSRPTIVADPWGQVHILWVDSYSDSNSASLQSEGPGDTIYYMMWDGEFWRESIDIIIQPYGSLFIAYPSATVGQDGQIYLIWSGQNALYFSQVSALSTYDVSRWQSPQIIARGDVINKSHIIVGPDNKIHVVYAELSSGTGGNVFYLSSTDKGETWSNPIDISLIQSEESISADPRILIDDKGWLHVVWTERAPPEWLGHSINYAHSEDDGKTWSSPRILFELNPGEVWSEVPRLVAARNGELHLVWVCGNVTHRCYSISKDGGYTWSSRERILGEFESRAGWDALLIDHEDNIHLFTQLRFPQGMYYSYKPANGRWSEPTRIVDRTGFERGHYPQITITEGNKIHVIWQKNEYFGDLVYMNITTLASQLTDSQIPTNITPVTTSPVKEETSTAELPDKGDQISPQLPNYEDTTSLKNHTLSPSGSIYLATIPALALIIIIVFIRYRNLRY